MSRIEFKNPAERIIVALDFDEISEARKLVQDIQDLGVKIKIGNQLGTYEGWKTAAQLAQESNLPIFFDTKFKDIPETVKKSSRSITRIQPFMFNVMADTNIATLKGAVEGLESAISDYLLSERPLLIGVTVLTSITEEECLSIYGADVKTKVLQFATFSALAGLDGVVCSAQEAKMLRDNDITKDLVLVTPGTRSTWASVGDQVRVTTPAEAIANGADYLVIGRPITQPPAEIGTPRNAILKIIEEIS